MKVAVAGAGSVGMAVSADLKEHGHDVLIIEKEPDVVDHGKAHLDVRWVVADACEASSLQAAGFAEMDVVVAATGDDEDNLVISLLAKQEFAIPRVIARVNNSRNQWLFNEGWGVDVAVSTPELYTSLVEEAVSIGALVHLHRFEGGQFHLVGITLAGNCPSQGKTLSDLQLPRDARVVAVMRRGQLLVPQPDTVLYSGDEVAILASVDAEPELAKLLVSA
ncbi:MAG: TrkA family potassium uptake protein [Candidatus Dormibacteraeota bacterium]|nr:TrkA family potassium uptake protein [Candidatus Dormibacteraeota bacterium]MBV9526609.1 TrkA family potassium uptake protein [Candidatus Dormibacteraeota bacterium]